MNKKLLGSLLIGFTLALGCASTAMADSRKVVTLGADLTDEQQSMMLRYFGVSANAVDIIYIDNDDEREHLGSYVPLEQIGTRTFSCALVSPTTTGGIQVKTANLSWVTCNMIASTLSTSGVKNCQVVAASPFEVSGTGALTGVIMAYETAQESKLEPEKVQLANEELVTTANLSDEVGQSKATAIINATKLEVVENNITDVTEITTIVNNISNEYNVDISMDQSEEIAELMAKIAEQEYDITQLKATLDRVQANVAGDAGASEEEQAELEKIAVASEEQAKEAAISEAEENGITIIEDEEESSILDNTVVAELEDGGIKVEEGDTTTSVLEQEKEEQEKEDFGIPEATGETLIVEGETEGIKITEESEDGDKEESILEPVGGEAPSVLEETFSKENLDMMNREVFDNAESALEDAFEGNSVTDETGSTVYLTSEAGKKVPEAITDYVLKVLSKGGEAVAAEEAKDPEVSENIIEKTAGKAADEGFDDPDLKQIDKFVRRLVFEDSEELLKDSQLEGQDEVVLYNCIMKALKPAFGITETLNESLEEDAEKLEALGAASEEAVNEETITDEDIDTSVLDDEEVTVDGSDGENEFADFVEEEASF